MVASSALLWQLTRKTSSRQVKRTLPKATFTWEKGSLTNKRFSADSGISGLRAVDVDVDENGFPVLSLKNSRPADARKPDKMWQSVTLKGGVRKALAKTERTLANYRPAAKKLALRKVSAIYKAKSRKAKGITHASIKVGRGAEKEE